jgi:hypothetical protein
LRKLYLKTGREKRKKRNFERAIQISKSRWRSEKIGWVEFNHSTAGPGRRNGPPKSEVLYAYRGSPTFYLCFREAKGGVF